MEFRDILRQLWRYRVFVALGLLIAVVVALSTGFRLSLWPLEAERKRVAYGAAQTQVLLDTRRSSITQTTGALDGINQRAQIYARLISSPAVRLRVARSLGVEVNRLSVSGPVSEEQQRQGREPVAQQRANEVLAESGGYSLVIDLQDVAPVITIYGQAPTGELAVRLVETTAGALGDYLAELKSTNPLTIPLNTDIESLDVSPALRRQLRQRYRTDLELSRLVLRPVGRTTGGAVEVRSGVPLMVLTFIAVFLFLCVAILAVARGARVLARP